MHPIIYDVAVSLDGYIAGPGGDVSRFAHEGPVVDDYRARLAGYATAIMGRCSYEFGYRYGLQPGGNPYPHMRCIVVSRSLSLPSGTAVETLSRPDKTAIQAIQAQSSGPVYLCGGGSLAGAMLDMGLIDQLIVKRAPSLLGQGTRLFGEPARGRNPPPLIHRHSKLYDDGYLLQHYKVVS